MIVSKYILENIETDVYNYFFCVILNITSLPFFSPVFFFFFRCWEMCTSGITVSICTVTGLSHPNT